MLKTYALWELPLVKSLVVVILAITVYYLFRVKLFSKLARICESTQSELDDRVLYFARNLLSIFIIFFTVMTILNIYHVEISPLLAGAGIFGVSLALAARETLTDVLAGVFLIADRPVKIGDRIKIQSIGGHWGSWGDVVDIGLRRTCIRNTDGISINYPNNQLSNSIITNFSDNKSPIRVRIRFQVDFDADIDFIRSQVLDILEKNPRVLAGTGSLVVRSIGDDHDQSCISAISLEARYRITQVRKRTEIRSEILEALLKVMRDHKIPQPKLALEHSERQIKPSS
ncbi:mechanosensitive ion channel family protein [Endozoicomonas arenosclerae]|uniref:mechanosensitive ion channel family protein n=1 Tax=Endozoicomonas arenosclerae TaxID=1633495 RepID=UPI0007840992|nr:mechanosensitive ion channel domain-containing protein [Endozoicomonas arenosclerae]